MERLTEHHVNKSLGAYMACSAHCDYTICDVSCEEISKIVDRLAAYEDTGLEPEDIEGLLERGTPLERGTAELMKSYLSIGSVEHLRDFAQAEKDGRLVVLPCKVGAPVWEIGDFDGGNLKRRPFRVEDMSFWKFGTTVFLTREEAEAALKKREADTFG